MIENITNTLKEFDVQQFVMLVAASYWLHNKMKEYKLSFERHSDKLSEEIKNQGKRTDKLIEDFNKSILDQSKRSDTLYKMFVDLLKEKRVK